MRDRIDINRETARRYIRLADGFKSDAQLVHLGLRSVDAAIQHLDAKQKRIGAGSTTRTTVAVEEAEVETARSTVPSCEPVEVEVETARTTVPCAAVEPEVVEPDFQDFSKAVDEVAAEAGVALSLSPEELERLHIRIQDEDGSVVQILNRKVDRADQRHREDVAAINAERRATAAERRKNRDVCDAHLVAPLCECGSGAVHDADLLARFYAVQRKAPAA